MSKRSRHGPIMVTLGIAVAIMASSPAYADQVRIGMWKSITAPALHVARVKGYFEGEGVPVKWVEMGNPNQVVEGLAAGQLDAGVMTGPHYLTAVDKGVAVTAVALVAGRFKPSSSYLVRRDSGIKRVQDLKGKVVGVNNYGGVFDIYLRHQLEKHGLDPKKDVRIIEVPFFTVIQALLAKRIDAGAVDTLFAQLARTKFADTVEVLFSYDDVDVLKEKVNTLILVMSKDLVTKQRATSKRFLAAYLKGIAFTRENPQETVKIWADVAGTPLATQVEDFQLPADGKIDMGAMVTDISLSRRYGYLKAPLKAEEVVDHTLLDEVLGKR